MDGGHNNEKQLHFEVADRETGLPDTQPRRRQILHLRRLETRIRRVLPAVVAILLIATLALLVARIPSPPSEEPSQSLAAVPPEREVRAEPPASPEEPAPKRNHGRRAAKERKHRRIVLAKPKRREVSVGVAETPQGSVPSARPVRDRPDKEKRTKKTSQPRPTLLLQRLYKDKNGDHFHSVFDDAIAEKQAKGYEPRESIGYLFEKRVKGTILLAIDEGVMGWIYAKDQGKSTRPLYRLVGPDYHDYEVIFTSSEHKKTYWVGNGWRVEKVAGYVVKR